MPAADTHPNGLPKSIKIWSHDHSILKRKDPKHFDGENYVSVFGTYSSDRLEIVLSKRIPTVTREVEVLIHELLHGICYFTNVFSDVPEKRAHEEHVVDTIANGITLILKDNPKLIDYIKENLHGQEEPEKD